MKRYAGDGKLKAENLVFDLYLKQIIVNEISHKLFFTKIYLVSNFLKKKHVIQLQLRNYLPF